jgi:serine/threonine protein kinase
MLVERRFLPEQLSSISKVMAATEPRCSLDTNVRYHRSLRQVLKSFGPLPESTIRNYTRQIVAGLEYLHENKIVHNDIKPE